MDNSAQVGTSPLRSAPLAYGCWRIAGYQGSAGLTPELEAKGRAAVVAAYEAGYTLFDNADIYGRGHAERIFGDVLKSIPGMRDRIGIITKCGVRYAGDPEPDSPQRWDFSSEHILRSCEGSLQRMGVETIDLYLLHRPDFLANLEEIAAAFVELQRSGKVRFFGVSNFRPSLVSALQKYCPMKLICNEVEISLGCRNTLEDGTLDQCMEEKITPLAWSPLARGFMGEGGVNARPGMESQYGADKVIPLLDELARKYGVERAGIALAWLLKHPAKIIPILGSTTPDRILEATRAVNLELTREDWYRLLLAARGNPLP